MSAEPEGHSIPYFHGQFRVILCKLVKILHCNLKKENQIAISHQKMVITREPSKLKDINFINKIIIKKITVFDVLRALEFFIFFVCLFAGFGVIFCCLFVVVLSLFG